MLLGPFPSGQVILKGSIDNSKDNVSSDMGKVDCIQQRPLHVPPACVLSSGLPV